MTKPKNYHETIQQKQQDGKIIVGVHLTNHSSICWLDADDYQRLVTTHGLRAWFVNHNSDGRLYVRVKGTHGNNLMVARLILGDLQGSNVRYRDGDSLNLTRKNLYRGTGRGGDETTRKGRKAKDKAATSSSQMTGLYIVGTRH